MKRAAVVTAVLRIAPLLTIWSAVVATPVRAQGWTSQASGTIENLKTVDFPTSSIGYAAGQNGTILKTIDGGASWGPQTSGTAELLWSLDFLDSSTGYLVGQNGTVLKTTNGGAGWNPLNPGTSANLRDVYFVDALTGWIVGAGGEIRKTTDGGSSWNPQASGTTQLLQGVAFANASTGWVVGGVGTLLKTTDGGSTWNPQTSGTTEELRGVSAVSTSTAYVVGTAGTILKTTNGGSTWTPQTSGTTASIWHSHFVNASTGYVTGSNPTIILKTVDGGGTWVSQDPGTIERLRAVYFVDALEGWVVGDAGTILHTTDGGAAAPPFVVDTNSDVADGDTTSIANLLADKGADGFISLREAISATNNTPNGAVPDSITFAIGSGAQTITPATVLPTITEAVVIDGTTQPGFTSSPIIEISGATVGVGIGLNVTGGGSTIRGLVINRFTTGLRLASGDGNRVAGNYIGPDLTGSAGGVGNGSEGILIEVSRNNIIGSASVSDRNVISGNVIAGIKIEDIADGPGVTADGNRIIGNFVGTNAAGSDRIPTQQYGIWINGAPDTQVGGTGLGEGNVLSGNDAGGVWVFGADASGNLIRGNIIGLDETAANPVPNGVAGVGTGVLIMDAPGNTVGGPEAGAANVISGNEGVGVTIMNGILAGNLVSRNSIYGNADLGIDLSYDGVTPNDLGDVDTGPNELFNFPFIETAILDATDTLEIAGFARPGSNIELFVANPDATNFGEGETYLTSLTEGGAGDLDSGTGSYSHASAGDDDTNRFKFRIANPGGVAAGTSLTSTATDATAGTSEFSLVVEVVAGTSALISSAAAQTFWVDKAPTLISEITVAEGTSPSITTTNDIRIRIPTGFNMTWDVADLTATIAGNAAGNVSTTVSYEDAGQTLVVDVTTDFAPGDTITISDLSFQDFTDASAADNLELEVDNAGTVATEDDKTVEILANGTPTISSEFDQSFRVGDPPIAISTITVREDATAPSITAGNDIRIRIPSGFNMRWDGSDVDALILGTASGKVSSTVSYENGERVLVIDVLTDFDPGELITVSGLSFTSFNSASLQDNLELEVGNDGAVSAYDDKVIFVALILVTPDIQSSSDQFFGVGDPPTKMATIRITDDDVTPQITAANDIRIRIPADLDMLWDVTNLTPTLSGRGNSNVSSTVSYEDGGKTMVIDVLTTFSPSDWLNVKGVDFVSFTSASAPERLELEVYNDGSVAAVDQFLKEIVGGVISVDVWPDTVRVSQLPSNGTNYTADFTVSNIGSGTDSYDLLTSASPGTAISVISITGLDVSQGANPDSARLSNLPAADSRVVTVTYSVADVPLGTIDTLSLVARSAASPTESDDGQLILTVARPNLTMLKVVAPNGTQLPGTDLTYTVTATNAGSETALGVVSVDSLPAQVEFKVGSVVTSFPAGVGVTVEYSDDGGATWTYTPVSEGCGAPVGYDDCVDQIRWSLQDPLSANAPDNAGDMEFVARIK